MERASPASVGLDWWAQFPWATRHTLLALVLFYVASWFSSGLAMSVTMIPFYTILKLELHRLLLAPLFCNSIVSLVFVAVTFASMGARLESSLGTAQLVVLMTTIATLTQLMFILLAFLLASFGQFEALFFRCEGFWVVLMGLVVFECLSSPEGHRRLLFVPTPIPTKFFPLALFGLFSLFAGPRADMALSLLMGFAHQRGYLDLLKPSEQTVQTWESGCLANLTTRPHYITQASAQGMAATTAAPVRGEPAGERSSWANAFSRDPGPHSAPSSPAAHGQARSSSSSLGRPWAADHSSNAAGGPTASTVFPGGGHTLGSSVSASAPSQLAPPASDREAARAARLHAIGARSAAPDIPRRDSPWPAAVARLTEMGYARQDALAALEAGDGNLNSAINSLAS